MKLLLNDPEKGATVLAESDNISSLKYFATQVHEGNDFLTWQSGCLPEGKACGDTPPEKPPLIAMVEDGSSFAIEN